MGNFGLFFGNWGTRATLGNKAHKKLRQETQDRQIMKCPGQVIVLCEATSEVEELLRLEAVEGDPEQSGLEKRHTHEHYVVRGQEAETAVLIAARKDNTTGLECLEYEVHRDHRYKEKKR